MTKKQIELDGRFNLTIAADTFEAYLDAEYGNLPSKADARNSAIRQGNHIIILPVSFFSGVFKRVTNVSTAREAIVNGAMRIQRMTGGCEIFKVNVQ